MKTTVWCVALCLSVGLGMAHGQDLRIDFSQTNGPVEAGYQAYRADHEVPATFTAQSFAAFGTTVTITPTWAPGATAAAMQMILRPDDDASEAPDLIRDWIGTDGRQPGDPMTLTISGLPAGTYQWVSLHHDPQDQTGIFDVTVNDAAGSTTTTGIDISDVAVLALADMTKFATTIVSNGTDPVTLVFTRTSPTTPVATAFFVMNSFELTAEDTGGAILPAPAHQATDVFRDGTVLSWIPGEGAVSHDVYLGTDRDAVENATTADNVYMGRQSGTSFDPGRLELGETYYWRIDEVQADGTVIAGRVWSFTVEPLSIALTTANITATASSSNGADEGPEKTIDGSGLDADDLHSTANNAMWLSAQSLSDPVWIQYEFDRIYKLHQMLVWNHNTGAEAFVGLGVKDVTIEASSDGTVWTPVGEPREIAKASGSSGYAANTTVDLGGAAAKYIRINVMSNWGNIIKRYGLSEVRFMVIPVSAREPVPAVDAVAVDPRSVLSWRAGRGADKHQVYVSTDVNAVIDGTALVGTVSETQFDAASVLALGQTYYWKVNEVNDADDPSTWEGEVWSFSTSAFLPVDDMESYTDDEGSRIYETWLDGWQVPANGSVVGHEMAPFAETVIVHGGSQSMPFYYDNSTAAYSEATRTFDSPQDWTLFGVKGLVLSFYGDPANTPGQMYVKVNGKKVAYDGDPGDVQRKPWQMWYIDLAAFTGVNLKKVTELTIGLEGGVGLLFIDDIGLSPLDRQLVTPVQPATTGLVAKYAFEGDVKDSVGTRHGTVTGAPTYVAGKVGQAIKLDGARDFVVIESSFTLAVYSAAVWFRVDGGSGDRDILAAYSTVGGYMYGILVEVGNTGRLRYLHRAPLGTTGGPSVYSDFNYAEGAWHHLTVVKSADSMMMYVDGILAGSMADSSQFDAPLTKLALGVLRSEEVGRLFPGTIDEVYLYNRVLSAEEIAWLAGRTQPFDKP